MGHWLGLKHTFQSVDEGWGRAVCGDEGEGILWRIRRCIFWVRGWSEGSVRGRWIVA